MADNISEVLARNGLRASDVTALRDASNEEPVDDVTGMCPEMRCRLVLQTVARLLDEADSIPWRHGESIDPGREVRLYADARAILAEVLR